MVTQKISLWGNSLGVRLPQSIVKQIGLEAGNTISISIEGNKIVLSPVRPTYSLQELLQDVSPDLQHQEVDWCEPEGDKVW